MLKKIMITALLSLSFLLSGQSFAMKILPLNLQQITDESQDIVAGVVKSVEDGFDERGIPYTEVTIAVSKMAKGKNKDLETYTFRQFGLLKPRKLPNGNVYHGVSPEHFPTWAKDESVVVFLFKKASQTGLQAPVGLAQGKFSVLDGKVSNGITSKELFEGLELPSTLNDAEMDVVKNPQQMASRDFYTLVEKLVNEGGAAQ